LGSNNEQNTRTLSGIINNHMHLPQRSDKLSRQNSNSKSKKKMSRFA
jgi:hypothetical protein